MFEFFRRTGQKHLTGSAILRKSLEPRSFGARTENPSLLTLDDDDCDALDTDAPQSSRLSKTLSEVLADKNARSYFIQFLDQHDGLKYLKCYFDIQYFRSLTDADQFEAPVATREHDTVSLSTCDSFPGDSNSLFDYTMDISEIGAQMSELGLSEPRDRKRCISDSERSMTELALRIFKKYVALESAHFILCPDEFRNDLIERICGENGLDLDCFAKIRNYVLEVLDEKFFGRFLCSHFNCKYQIDVLTSGELNVQDILYNEAILFYFIEFLEQENVGALLECWFAASNFCASFKNNAEAQNDAIVLYDKYFSLQATCPIGFSDKVRFLVEQNICDESGIYPTCFAVPVKLIENYLQKHYLKHFVTSQLYFKYLSELISTVQTVGLRTHQRSHSDSSEYSNTLLADSNFPKLKPGKNDMSIDTRHLYDPDSLWRRRTWRRLSFGRITELGRFETDVEPNPNRRTESRLTKVVKRLINVEETKSKEEMAWQIAEMIVKDVTDVTLKDFKT